jgi:hypothetical protein
LLPCCLANLLILLPYGLAALLPCCLTALLLCAFVAFAAFAAFIVNATLLLCRCVVVLLYYCCAALKFGCFATTLLLCCFGCLDTLILCCFVALFRAALLRLHPRIIVTVQYTHLFEVSSLVLPAAGMV